MFSDQHRQQVSTPLQVATDHVTLDENALFHSLFQMFCSFSNKLFRHFLLHKLMVPFTFILSGCVIGGGISFLFISENSTTASSHSKIRSKGNTFMKSLCVASGALLGLGISNLLCSMYVGLQTWKRASRLLMLDFRDEGAMVERSSRV
ncbi:hypothetical protein C9374_013254 [Naegleria lovaniensis]|uniref:Uncharacterized protein n=1 Tax=Naegleria lovaniensis TaxID=51637 RepID=A0AA88GWE6_NAELO|nr:uncharacterized protein C9374_013254 [Naegleria lovaniensis]KAG2391769.1 hypothetical protein C9374_013254 [Naegleria lovaniensis]